MGQDEQLEDHVEFIERECNFSKYKNDIKDDLFVLTENMFHGQLEHTAGQEEQLH